MAYLCLVFHDGLNLIKIVMISVDIIVKSVE